MQTLPLIEIISLIRGPNLTGSRSEFLFPPLSTHLCFGALLKTQRNNSTCGERRGDAQGGKKVLADR